MRRQVPKHCFHRASGRGVVRIQGRDYYTGAWGTPEADREYHRLISLYVAARAAGRFAMVPTNEWSTVEEVIARYFDHMESRWNEPGNKEIEKLRQALSILRLHHGATRASDFSIAALESIRMVMIQRGWTRPFVNRCVRMVRNLFRWAARAKIVPSTVWADLLTVETLKRGEFGVKESRKVRPVSPGNFTRTIKRCRPVVRDLAIVQWLTGMRAGEVCAMRPRDIDRTGRDPNGARHHGLWVYVPTDDDGNAAHKTAHLGVDRVVFLGPRAQRVLAKYMDRPADSYLFSPREGRESWFRERRALRKTKVQPSQICRRVANPKRAPGAKYITTAVGRAIKYAAKRAGVPHWHPHQLRHLRATQIRSKFGPEEARIVLGHKLPGITGIYAEGDLSKAAKVMRAMG